MALNEKQFFPEKLHMYVCIYIFFFSKENAKRIPNNFLCYLRNYCCCCWYCCCCLVVIETNEYLHTNDARLIHVRVKCRNTHICTQNQQQQLPNGNMQYVCTSERRKYVCKDKFAVKDDVMLENILFTKQFVVFYTTHKYHYIQIHVIQNKFDTLA